ncbi:hypothetical protein CU011_0231 [Enterococcus faecium]|nr:hypothetical protein [Enterococcus faecium]MBK4860405.1 hypothetical protein [Enterococcus faecium]MBK4874937.1 hypothetical protein [Enterococcus faecium]
MASHFHFWLLGFIKYLSRRTPNSSVTQIKVKGRNRLSPISVFYFAISL